MTDKLLVQMKTTAQDDLLNWYQLNKRVLPWRRDQDAYRIWISEIMLQQTTVVAVIPFYEKFLERFKNLQQLANAPEEEVLKYWSGLGYYSRARNIHKAAKILVETGFSKFSAQLSELPGFGPYTSRAVSSISFEEKVGVVDGNVIRVLTRYLGLKWEWWRPKERLELQKIADRFAQVKKPSQWNQALMELGSSICTPQKPACILCPVNKSCVAFADGQTQLLPLLRPRKKKEIWIWQARLVRKNNKILLIKNNYAPFLKNQWLPPGYAFKKVSPPKKYLFKHMITHHEIYVVVDQTKNQKQISKPSTDQQWVELKNLTGISPTSLVAKLVESVQS